MKKRTSMSVIALTGLLAMALLGSVPVGAQVSSTVLIEPNVQTIDIGNTAVVEIWVNGVDDFYGVEFDVSFDPLIVHGVDVVPGAAFDPYPSEHEIVESSISDGVVSFAATMLRVAKAPPLSGDLHLATITFTGLNYGTSPLTWPDIKLADSSGNVIAYETLDSSVIVRAEQPFGNSKLTGRAFLEGRSAYEGIAVELSNGAFYTTTTASTGWYEFVEVAAQAYTVTFGYPMYLTAAFRGCTVNPEETAWLPDVTLLGGDLNGDEVVDISDLVLGAANFNTAEPLFDINGDGLVDIFDIVIVGKNFGLTGPIILVCAP